MGKVFVNGKMVDFLGVIVMSYWVNKVGVFMISYYFVIGGSEVDY